jgi:hypothetical protein
VTVSGAGLDVRPSHDDREVYARGSIPMVVEQLEAPIRAFVGRA